MGGNGPRLRSGILPVPGVTGALFRSEVGRVETGPIHLGFAQEIGVDAEGIAVKTAFVEKNGLPEGVHFWEMRVPIHGGDFLKDGPKQRIFADLSVEMINKPLDVSAAFDIRSLAQRV